MTDLRMALYVAIRTAPKRLLRGTAEARLAQDGDAAAEAVVEHLAAAIEQVENHRTTKPSPTTHSNLQGRKEGDRDAFTERER